ncbi:heme ABC transporter permease, partial [Methanococcoides sp. SA1]|nr:heme ABC transporter permease [Methanococcoides sp. SA1]
LGTVGFVCVGTLLSALTVNTRTREILLPVLLLPLLLPALIPAVMATGSILMGASYGDISQELRLLLVYDIVFFLVAQLVFEYVIQD